MKIHVLIPCYNCEQWIGRCIESALMQDCDVPVTVYVIDDASTDRTAEAIQSTFEHYRGDFLCSGWRNEHNQKCPRNLYEGIARLDAAPEDVIFLLDGDDFLPHSQVFSEIAAVYEDPDVWLTYGNYRPDPVDTGQAECLPYPKEVIENRSYRPFGMMYFNHPLTFRKFLWDAVSIADLCDPQGNWFPAGYDQAIMLPMLELATPYEGQEHFRYLPEVLYCYNAINPASDYETETEERKEMLLELWRRPPREPLNIE